MSDSTHTWECPECEASGLPIGVSKCKRCGYVKKSEYVAGKKVKDLKHGLCCFIGADGNQCPMPGARSNAIKRSEKWYCSNHVDDRYSPDAELMYQDAKMNLKSILRDIFYSFANNAILNLETFGKRKLAKPEGPLETEDEREAREEREAIAGE